MESLIKKQYNGATEGSYADYTMIKNLLQLESDTPELDELILKSVNWIETDAVCNVKGSKELIELYNSIDNEKMDLTLDLSEIEYVGFFHDSEIILNLDGYNARGLYKFTDTFLDSLFSIKKFGKFCLSHGEKDLLNENINKLMETQKNEVRQYRFLMYENDLFLRGLTGTSYKNYDNNIAIYIALHSLHRYSKENGTHVFVEQGYITDSNLDITFVQEETYNIDKNTYVEIGIRLTNNEITDGKLSLEFIYTIFDKKNNKFRAIGDTVVGINHRYKISNIQGRLNNLNKLVTYTNETIQHISIFYA